MALIHSKLVQPRIYGWYGSRTPEQIDRAQTIGGSHALSQTKLYEIGRDLAMGVRKETPQLSYSMTQYEYGSMALWYAMAGKSNPGALDPHSVSLEDIHSKRFDIAAYMTDNDNVFKGTAWFPNLRINGFTLNIGAPDAIIERSFDLIGEDSIAINEAYLAYEMYTVLADGDAVVTCSPDPVEYALGKYIYRVIRVRGASVEELSEDATATLDNTWSYDNLTKQVTVKTCLIDDVIKVAYISATADGLLWVDNDVDLKALFAENAEIFIKVGSSSEAKKLQSIGLDVKLDRTDYREIGNRSVVQTGVTGKTVTASLNRFNEGFSYEDIFAGSTGYPVIDPRDFVDNIQLMVKIYSDYTKTTFKIGYLITGLSPTNYNLTQNVNENNQAEDTLESDNILISDKESEIVFA